MRYALLPLAAALALALAPDASAKDGRIADWSHGEAGIYTHTQDGPMPVGTVAADGTIGLDWPTPPSFGQTLADTFPSCTDDGSRIANPWVTEFFPTILFVARGEGEELGSLRLATSPEVAAWQDSYGQEKAAEGSWFQWVRVTQDSTVEAECTTTMYTGEGDDNFQIVTHYQVAFAEEWNLMRNDITSVHTSPSGKTHVASTKVSALQAMPEDAEWYFFGQ